MELLESLAIQSIGRVRPNRIYGSSGNSKNEK
jgi:hypothetical protein